jgi:hypothetical protein
VELLEMFGLVGYYLCRIIAQETAVATFKISIYILVITYSDCLSV